MHFLVSYTITHQGGHHMARTREVDTLEKETLKIGYGTLLERVKRDFNHGYFAQARFQ